MPEKPVTAMSIKMVAQITSYEEKQLHGVIDSIYFKEPFEFVDVAGMIEIMETAFDALGFPDKALLPRTFGKAKERMRRREMDLEKILRERYAGAALPDEALCVFEIFVNFRHNAEWQGRLRQASSEETKEFRSIIELVKLIDEAM